MSETTRKTLWQALFVERHGNITWDGVLRGTGVVAVLALPVVIYLPASVGGLVAFMIVTIWVNGPIGIFLPATYEPILMLFGRIYPSLLIGALGIIGVLYVEFLNYYLYGKLVHLDALRGARESKTVSRIVGWFRKAPFFTVWMCSWSPLPYWAVRILAPMAGYSVRRYLLATFLGRFPRLWFFAALGTFWGIDTAWLVGISIGSIIVGLGIWYSKSRARRADGVAEA